MYDNYYFLHIDYLRESKRISIKDFCENICDTRTYRRYKNNERKVSQEMINLFSEKLLMSPEEFYSSFNKSNSKDNQQLTTAWQALSKKDLDKARVILQELNKNKPKSTDNYQFLRLCNAVYDLKNINPTYPVILKELRDLIDYPNCFNKPYYTFIELSSLNQMAYIEATINNDHTISEKLLEIIRQKNFTAITSNTRYYLGPIYETIAQSFGMRGDLETALEVSKLGIEFSLHSRDTLAIHNLYYFASLCSDRLGFKEDALDYAKKSIATCIAMNDFKGADKINNMFLREQGYKIELIKKI